MMINSTQSRIVQIIQRFQKLYNSKLEERQAHKKSIDEKNLDIFDFEKNVSLSDLKTAIEEQCLIVFWGAGVSRLAGCKGWRELAECVIDKLTDSGIFSHSDSKILSEICSKDLKKALTICKNVCNDDDKLRCYYDAILSSVTPSHGKSGLFQLAHKSIIELDAYSYVTTNIDKGIETVQSQFSQDQRVFDLTSDSDVKEDWGPFIRNGNIFYLHGSVDNIDRSIFSNESYHEFYSKRQIRNFLEMVFSRNAVVLFIGYGLEDYEILAQIYLAKKRVSDPAKVMLNKSYYLVPAFQNELDRVMIEEEYLKSYGIVPLVYFIDYANYDLLLAILNQLRDKIFEIRYSKDPVPPRIYQ